MIYYAVILAPNKVIISSFINTSESLNFDTTTTTVFRHILLFLYIDVWNYIYWLYCLLFSP